MAKGLDGILTGGAEAGVERAEEHADEADGSGDGPPIGHYGLGERSGHDLMDQGTRAEAEDNSQDGAADPHGHRLSQNDAQDETAGGAQGLEDADFAGTLEHRHVHGEKDDRESDDDSDADHNVDEGFERATLHIFDGVEGSEIGHAVNVVVGQQLLQFGGDRGNIRRAGGLYKDLRTNRWASFPGATTPATRNGWFKTLVMRSPACRLFWRA